MSASRRVGGQTLPKMRPAVTLRAAGLSVGRWNLASMPSLVRWQSAKLARKSEPCAFCSKTAPLRSASNQAVENRILAKARNEHHGRQSLYFQSTVSFPSWTSLVRVPSPAHKSFRISNFQPLFLLYEIPDDTSRTALRRSHHQGGSTGLRMTGSARKAAPVAEVECQVVRCVGESRCRG